MKNVFAIATAAAVASLLMTGAAIAAPGDIQDDQSPQGASQKKWLDPCIVTTCAPGATAPGASQGSAQTHGQDQRGFIIPNGAGPFGRLAVPITGISPFVIHAVNTAAGADVANQPTSNQPPANLPSVR